MEILFTKSKWEAEELSLEAYFQRVKNSGFDGVEFALFDQDPKEVGELCAKYEMELVGWLFSDGPSPEAHAASLEERFLKTVDFNPGLINMHLGKDYFSFADNLAIIEQALELSKRHGIPVVLETHRGRPTYSLIETLKYLEALPALRLNADISHWMVVHESDLSDQAEQLDAAMARADHIHARVGYEEGPQISDPRAPEWAQHITRHIDIWRKVILAHEAKGSEKLRITPEFGPPPYVHTTPFTNEPVVDVWECNVEMMKIIKQAFEL